MRDTGQHGYGEQRAEHGSRVVVLTDGDEARRMLGVAPPRVPLLLRFDGKTVTRVD